MRKLDVKIWVNLSGGPVGCEGGTERMHFLGHADCWGRQKRRERVGVGESESGGEEGRAGNFGGSELKYWPRRILGGVEWWWPCV